jgi:hypothetical protein
VAAFVSYWDAIIHTLMHSAHSQLSVCSGAFGTLGIVVMMSDFNAARLMEVGGFALWRKRGQKFPAADFFMFVLIYTYWYY